jgi:hypothetical protein
MPRRKVDMSQIALGAGRGTRDQLVLAVILIVVWRAFSNREPTA